MPELITEAITALRLEASAYPVGVQVWMKIMAASFFSGLVIAWWDRRALWIVAMAALTASLLVVGKISYPDLPRSISGAIIHLVIWPPALIAIWRRGRTVSPVFVKWRYWVSAVATVSLVFDFKELSGWF